jgi:CheY-like chemotaxis protein
MSPGMADGERHHCSILVVDDDADVREVLRLSLESAGYRVATVANGRDALHHLRSHADTCLILLDLMLPSMDGAAFRKAQQRDRSLAWIPVLILSGAPDGEERARELGARSFVPKPLDLDKVHRALGNIRCRYSQNSRGGGPDRMRRSA